MDSGFGEKPSHFHAYMTDAERWRKSLKGFARSNRSNSTAAENCLWQLVRSNKPGPRFRRQHAIENYIVDFVCLPAWLIVEVDGEYHFDVEQTEYDGGRTHRLEELGFCILRFTNEEVMQQPDYVLNTISNRLTKLLPTQKPSGSPSPQGGKGAGG